MRTVTYEEIRRSPYTKIVTSSTIDSPMPLHNHTFFEFIICLDGTIKNTVDSVTLELKKGDVQLIRPQDEHTMTLKNHTHRDVYVMPKEFKAICDCIDPTLYEELSKTPFVINFSVSDFDLQQLEMRLNFFNDADRYDERTLRAAHTSIVTELLHLWHQSRQSNSSDTPPWLDELSRQLNTEKFLTMSVSDIIASTNYSHGHVCREFKKYFGVALNDYLTAQKFAYAKSLLCNSEITIAEIAERLNYGSASNFVIAFKKRFGETPTKWRKGTPNY